MSMANSFKSLLVMLVCFTSCYVRSFGVLDSVLSKGLMCSIIKVFCVTFTANVLLQHWHLMITSAWVSLLEVNFASESSFSESQALLLQIGH